MKTSHAAFAIVLTAATLGGLAIAGSTEDFSPLNVAQADQWLEIPAIYEKVTAAGYTAINDIERERNGYEVEATSPPGERVELLVDPITGAVLDSRAD